MIPRGIRNCNPGNIRKSSTRWKGMSDDQSDSSFVRFISMPYGCRALIMVLRTYRNKYGLSTIRDIISRWAPPNENDTEAYIRFVAGKLNKDPDEILDRKAGTYIDLAKAICHMENGSCVDHISEDDWYEAVELI